MTDTDIVERLRIRANDKFIRDYPLMAEAADEIEWLQAAKRRALAIVDERAKEIERLRAAPITGSASHKLAEAAMEIERLREQVKLAVWSDSEECKMLTTENERLRAYSNHERSLGAEGPMIELTQAKQEVEDLRETHEIDRAFIETQKDAIVKLRKELQDAVIALQYFKEEAIDSLTKGQDRNRRLASQVGEQQTEIERLRDENEQLRSANHTRTGS